ncbi:alpha/beta hydrolase [Streptomyces oryzae]|uniref:Alpha/beta hydrolase n=1 Tax=Streptomyces oryzae TaxID=1434886 RepID=A0ABS3XKM7_9ACTN|nr:alpha/beta hydrolase [Streptomyces oryzae]MBO8195636.1 alpha/beta hydrolase [Streptomyces oryzae]
MIRTPRAAAALLAAAVLSTTATACASAEGPAAPGARSAVSKATGADAQRDTRLAIPRPTGPWAIGRDTLQLTDEHRRDLWVPSAGARRVMVSLFYPARRGAQHGARAPYISAKEAELLLKGLKLDTSFQPGRLTSVRTNARTGARPAPGRHPLVVLSPGFTLHRATLTRLSEELASHGYVVALLDHAYESFGTTFTASSAAPSDGSAGRTLTCVACKTVESAPDDAAEKRLLARAARNRAADISFVVDELTTPSKPLKPLEPSKASKSSTEKNSKRPRDYAALIDPRRIGAAGHSLGGNAAAVAAGTDRRIKAAGNLDGSFFAPVPRAGAGRPVLMLGTRKGHNPRADDVTWPRTWQRLHGWKRWLTVAGSGHFTFIDLPILGGQAGVTDPSAPLSGKRSGEITTQYVTAFFDHHLRGLPRPLLDGPSKENPEVDFHTP